MRRLWTVALAGLTAALLVSGAPAWSGEAMRFRIDPAGGRILAKGEIRADTPAQLRKVLSKLNGRKLPLIVTSPGGRLSAALAMGRMIRKHGLDVTVKGTCTSACPFVLAGGVERQAEPGAVVGVHQALMIRSGKAEASANPDQLLRNTSATAKQFRQMRNRLRAYLGEMGVSPELVLEMDNASPFEMNVLSPQRQEELKLVTADAHATSSFGLSVQSQMVTKALLTSSMEPLP